MTLNNEQKEAALSILTSMLNRLGLPAEARIEERDEQTVVRLKSEEPGRLIGRRGRVIENLEYLLNRCLSQRFEGAIKISIDVDGSGHDGGAASKQPQPSRPKKNEADEVDAEQKEQLQQIVLDAAKEVRRWGSDKVLGPFTADERRIVHQTAADETGVELENEGGDEESRKKVRIRAVDK